MEPLSDRTPRSYEALITFTSKTTPGAITDSTFWKSLAQYWGLKMVAVETQTYTPKHLKKAQ